jgi:phospholipid transport system substrate-binding protein
MLLPLAAWASPGGTPMAALKAKNGEVEKILRQKVDKGTVQEKKQKDEIKSLAANLLDYDELGKRSLAQHWTKLNPLQQKEFIATLRELIERNYVKQLRSNLDYQVQYKGEQVEGEDATVNTIVKVKSQGKNSDAEIVYKMRKIPVGVGPEWRVWDVITDEVSLVRNYRTQFNKIITEQGYDALIKKMKKKLSEQES